MTSRPFLSVVIPAYNEEGRLPSTLRRICGYLERRGESCEVLIVDDGSRDRTAEVALECGVGGDRVSVRVLRNPSNRGKGYSVRRGMLAARADLAVFSDADLSTPIEELETLESALRIEQLDIVFGSRDVAGSRVEIHQSRFRENSGKIFNRIMRFVLGLPFHDTQCGFKLFLMRECRFLFERQRIEGFGFDVELLYMARLWGLKVKEVPVVWRHSGESKVRFLSDAPGMLVDLFRIRWYARQGFYDR